MAAIEGDYLNVVGLPVATLLELAPSSSRRRDSFAAVLSRDPPFEWARAHRRLAVSLYKSENKRFGWLATLIGDDDELVMGFNWSHVDEMLLGTRRNQLPFPFRGHWSDIEEGCYSEISAEGPDVYFLEVDPDEVPRIKDPERMERGEPGLVLIDGVEVRWQKVARELYDDAWSRAVAVCRAKLPRKAGSRVIA